MTISAVKDPDAWTIFEGSGSNQTRLGRVTRVDGAYVFTPDTNTPTGADVMRAIAARLDQLNTP